MSSTRDREAFPKTFSCRTLLRLASTLLWIFQWDSNVFVSPINAPALMIRDVYSSEDTDRLTNPFRLDGIVLSHRLSEFEFQSLAVLLDHLDQNRRNRPSSTGSPGPLESDSAQKFPHFGRQVDAGRAMRAVLWLQPR